MKPTGAMTAGEYDGIAAALEEHRAAASESVVAEARVMRDRPGSGGRSRARSRSARTRAMEALTRSSRRSANRMCAR